MVDEHPERGEHDDAESCAEVAAVHRREEDTADEKRARRGVVHRGVAAAADVARDAGQAAQPILEREQGARQEQEERHDPLEEILRADHEQDRTREAAARGRRREHAQPPALTGEVAPLRERATEVAGAQRDRVGDVGSDARHPERDERRERDERAPAGHRVDDARTQRRERGQKVIGGAEIHGGPPYGSPV
jgi:hypothetical protein